MSPHQDPGVNNEKLWQLKNYRYTGIPVNDSEIDCLEELIQRTKRLEQRLYLAQFEEDAK